MDSRSAPAATLLACLASTGSLSAVAEPAQLETVTVVGKRPEPLQHAAAAVSVITAAQIEALVALDMADVLRREPGVSMPRDPQRFGTTGVTVRGIGGNRVQIETDGVPGARGFAIGSFANTGRQYADLELVERVELLRGPASALYGSDAIAGVLATTTLDPSDLLTAGDAFLRARVGYAEDDNSLLTGLTGAMRSGAMEGLLAFAHRDAGEIEHAGGAPPPNPRDAYSDAILARAIFAPGARPLRLTAQWNREHVRTDVDALELSGGRFANTVLLQGDDRVENAGLLLDQDFSGAAGLDFAVWRAWWSETDVLQQTYEERRAVPVPPASPPLAIEREFSYDERVTGGELTLGRELAAGSGPHRLLGGIELLERRVTESRDGLQTDLATGQSTSTVLGESLPVRDFPISRIREAGVYLQDEWRPGNGDWALIPALRGDWYRLQPTIDPMYAEDNPSEPPVSVEESSISPKLGVARRFGDDLTAYLQYAHGFRAPPSEDVNFGLYLSQLNVRAIPNPDLESERSDSLELGIRFAGDAIRGSTAVFGGRYRDFIARVNIGVDPETGTTLFQSQNLTKAEIVGIEAALEFSPGAWHPALANLTGHLSASWTDGEDTSTGKPINSIDPPRGILGIRYDAPSGVFGIGLELTIAGAKHDVDETAGPLYRPNGHEVLDLRLQWRPHPRFTASFGLFNLTDAAYHEWSAVRGLAPDNPLLPLYREPGRNFAVTVTTTLD